MGAYHFANKPFNLDDVRSLTVAGARDRRSCGAKCGASAPAQAQPYGVDRIVGAVGGDGDCCGRC